MTRYLTLAAVLSIALLTFANGLGNPFVWDEFTLISGNPVMRSWDLWSLVITPFIPPPYGLEGVERYRPLTTFSFWLDYRFWHLNPVGYHVTSLAIHLLNGWLLLALSQAWLGQPIISAVLVALFMIHPTQPQAVTYIPSRGDLLAGTGCLFVIWLHRRYRTTSSPRTFLAELFIYGCAVLSKESALVIPFLVLAYDHVYHPVPSDNQRASRRRRFEWVGWCAVILVYVLIRAAWVPFGTMAWPLGALDRLRAFGDTMGVYARWLVAPSAVRFPVVLAMASPWWMGIAWGGASGGLGWLVWTGRLGRTIPAFRFGCLWLVVTLLPVANLVFLVDPPIAANYLYVPAMGLWLAVGAATAALMRRLPRPVLAQWLLVGCAAIIGIAWVRQTVIQNRRWGDPVALYQVSVNAGPPWTGAGYHMLALYHLQHGQPGRAIEMARLAVRERPQEALGYIVLGGALDLLGQVDDAEKAFRQAVALDPLLSQGFTGVARLHARRGQWGQALAAHQHALRVGPQDVYAYVDYGVTLAHLKRYDDAIAQWQKALALDPQCEDAERYLERATVLRQQPTTD